MCVKDVAPDRMIRQLSNDYVEMWVKGDFVMQVFKPGTIIDADLGRRIVRDRLKLTENADVALYADIRHVISIDAEAREFFATDEATRGLIRAAFWTDTIFNSLFVRLFTHYQNPSVPMRFFMDRQEALDWLMAEQQN